MNPSFVNTANPAGSPKLTDLQISAASTSEFERFEDLANKLLCVPKSSLDAKLTQP